MTEIFFALSVGFVGYCVYAIVDEQKSHNARLPRKASITEKSPKLAKPRKTAVAKKKKPASKEVKKAVQKPTVNMSKDVLAYLKKNGLTTIAKLNGELPAGKKAIQDSIEKLIGEGKISQTTVGRARAVELTK
jgi:predicted HTH transcriptional regulator